MTLVSALWFGSGVFVAIAAAAVFRIAGPDAIGAMLTRWHYIALLAPLALVILEWRRQRTAMVLLLFTGIVIAAAESLLDIRISALRRDPVRPHFALLHGISVVLLLADIVIAATVVGKLRNRP